MQSLMRIVRAFGYSCQGLMVALKEEPAFLQEVLVAIVIIPLALYLTADNVSRAVLICVWLLVLVVELLNSAIEAIVDKTTPERHPLTKRAKDMGSAAVFLAIVNAIVVWVTILWF